MRDERGYTSEQALEWDRRAIVARLRELGYRRPNVGVRQGVSVDGGNLIITFAVDEGPLTRVADFAVRGNTFYTAERLRELVGGIIGGAFSRADARRSAERIINFYRDDGYLNAQVRYDVVELPARDGEERVRLIYTVEEGDKVFVNRIVVNGNVVTERNAILNAIPLAQGELLRGEDLFDRRESERDAGAEGIARVVADKHKAAKP